MLANRKATRIQLVHDLGLGLMLLLPRVLLLLTILVLLYHMLGRRMTLWRWSVMQLLLRLRSHGGWLIRHCCKSSHLRVGRGAWMLLMVMGLHGIVIRLARVRVCWWNYGGSCVRGHWWEGCCSSSSTTAGRVECATSLLLRRR